MNIISVENIADLIVSYRKSQNLTQKELASLCNVGVRFISDIENAKPTCQIGKTLKVMQTLGIKFVAQGIIDEK